ncbi:hypothetical protein CFC21_051188 [Triticum aestivum]|uniref:Uncharacterized protein n=3 Tax=Triticum TaxID=4564 RepID=A0A9R0S4K7_TRITD|nr:hypothetical protein CFC21_051188 [Triticum aestivum]VAH87701.1 unnamed protein product [Triticum turgidum subsp. durum]
MKLRRRDAEGHAAVKPQHCKDVGREAVKVKDAKPLDCGTTKSGATKPHRCVAGGCVIAKYIDFEVRLPRARLSPSPKKSLPGFRSQGSKTPQLQTSSAATDGGLVLWANLCSLTESGLNLVYGYSKKIGMWRSCRRGFEEDNSVRSFHNILPLVQTTERTPSLPRPCWPASSDFGGRSAATSGGLTTTVTTMQTAQSQNVSPHMR